MKVLFLTPWYPNRYDAMLGLFVRKHAQAVARQGNDVHVLYICYDNRVKDEEIVETKFEGVNEIIMYTNIVESSFQEILTIKKAWKIWHIRNGFPDIVHLNVVTKLGLLPLYLWKKYNIPYVITEHWTGYLEENGDFKGNKRKLLARYIVNHAHAIMPVSNMLKTAMLHHKLLNNNYQVVYNVVDDFFYDRQKKEYKGKFRFIHISCYYNRAKNTIGILEAVKSLFDKGYDFEMLMVGTGPDIDATKQFAEENELIKNGLVKFVGEQTPKEIKYLLDNSDCFVLFSNYETAAVVLEESLVCGIPIISTPVGIAVDIINKNVGLLVDIKDIKMLTSSMEYMINNINQYNVEKIKEIGKMYSFEEIGHQIDGIYKKALCR